MQLLKIPGIYRITNINTSKYYIGSSKNVRKRIYSHCHKLKKNIHDNEHLQNSYNKHGKNKFKFEIIEYCDHYSLLTNEQYWIDQYDFEKELYNILPRAGSHLGHVHSEETKIRIAEAQIGIRKPKSIIGDDRIIEGLDSVTEKRVKGIRKKVIQIDINTLEEICIFYSIGLAARTLSVSHSTISKALRGINYSAAGYMWEYFVD